LAKLPSPKLIPKHKTHKTVQTHTPQNFQPCPTRIVVRPPRAAAARPCHIPVSFIPFQQHSTARSCPQARLCLPLPIPKHQLSTLKPSCLLVSRPSKWLNKPLGRRPKLRLNSSMYKDNLASSWRRRGEAYGVQGVQANIETRMTPREATRLVNQVKGSLYKGLGDTKGKGNEVMEILKSTFRSSKANLIRTSSLIGYKRLKESLNTKTSRKARR